MRILYCRHRRRQVRDRPANQPAGTAAAAFTDELVSCRQKGEFVLYSPDRVEFMDIAPSQMSRCCLADPVPEHDEQQRASPRSDLAREWEGLGTLQRQASVPGSERYATWSAW